MPFHAEVRLQRKREQVICLFGLSRVCVHAGSSHITRKHSLELEYQAAPSLPLPTPAQRGNVSIVLGADSSPECWNWGLK